MHPLGAVSSIPRVPKTLKLPLKISIHLKFEENTLLCQVKCFICNINTISLCQHSHKL